MTSGQWKAFDGCNMSRGKEGGGQAVNWSDFLRETELIGYVSAQRNTYFKEVACRTMRACMSKFFRLACMLENPEDPLFQSKFKGHQAGEFPSGSGGSSLLF